MSTISPSEERVFAEMTASLRAAPTNTPSRLSHSLTRHRMSLLAIIWAVSLWGVVAMAPHPAAAIACVVSLVAATAAIAVDFTTAQTS